MQIILVFDKDSIPCLVSVSRCYISQNRMLYVSEMAALKNVNVPRELVESFERATFCGKKYFPRSQEKCCYYYHLQATVRRKLFYALFNAQNVHVWLAKHARLAGETCTLKSVN